MTKKKIHSKDASLIFSSLINLLIFSQLIDSSFYPKIKLNIFCLVSAFNSHIILSSCI